VGKNVVESIIEAREQERFSSFQDFLTRVSAQASTKRVVESLIKAGAFDSLGHTRRSLIAIHEEAIETSAMLKRQAASGQVDLFGGLMEEDPATIEIPKLPEWTKRDLLANEREMLGLYVSDHPLAGMEAELMRYSDMGSAALRDSEIRRWRDCNGGRSDNPGPTQDCPLIRKSIRPADARGLLRRDSRDVYG
jgi:DNA polymerase-3 subunit alpha